MQEVINALIQSEPRARFLLVDPTLASHPLLDLTGDAHWQWHSDSISEISNWAKSSQPSIDTAANSFSESAARFMSEQLNSGHGERKDNFLRNTIGPIIEREEILSLICQDRLTRDCSQIKSLEQRLLVEERNLPTAVSNAVHSALGFAFERLGEFETAIHHRNHAYIASQRALGDSAPDTVQAATFLFQSIARSGKTKYALRLANDYLTIARNALGTTNPLTLEIANALAGILAESGSYREACPLFREILESLKEQGVSENSDMTLSASSNLGLSMMRSGREMEAFEVLSDVNSAYLAMLGKSHRDTAQATINLSECALRLGLIESAVTHSIEAIEVIHALPIEHPLRAYAATVSMQCFDLAGNEYQNFRLHKKYVEPLLQLGGKQAEKIRDFIAANPDYRPDASVLPDDEFIVYSVWLNVAWDGAVNWGDVDCMCVIACANMTAEGYYLLCEAVGERGIRLATSPRPDHWINRIVAEHSDSAAAGFAASLRDADVSLDKRQKKSLSVLSRIHEIVPKSNYFGHPIQFGRLPPRTDA